MPTTFRVRGEVRVRGHGSGPVFAFPEFRTVFAAHLISMLGETAGGVALSVLVYRLTGSPLLSALTFATALLPYVIGGTRLSSVAHRCPARRVAYGARGRTGAGTEG
jgi:hypothetical protein